MSFNLTDQVVDLVQLGFDMRVGDASDGGKPTESVSLAFSKVAYTYTPLKPNGQPDAPVTLKWNVGTNQEF